ncbi:hypothetical protein GCM10011374_39810 [Kocuria dechangensis]|uniref:CAAX prenyl protease 2/Lysostaphin resistance protein A-like domain-containing protein n=1 Tax=Kocuria dechangensis TaxID=1176249 RepID=A0A917H902_9MICC|nr:CPBP family intramembrane glutamic endopeptidase [Kocuria dechangensis]GGG71179.1 hypothetical protein GCM10011374_39810 [Kocuria dechangensis]
MKNLRTRSPISHALAWIVLLIVLVGIGDTASAAMGRDNAVTAPILVVLSVVLLLYVKANGWLGYYGLRAPRSADHRATLYFLPLLLMVLLQVPKGFDHRLDGLDIALVAVLMLCVGFLEELIFRGFLYQAIREQSGVRRAIVISGVTFGIGHVVNLARGYTGEQQLLQIVVAVAIGLVLALLVALTGSIMPGVVFHILLNISGDLTTMDLQQELYVSAAVHVVCLGYGAHLARQLRCQGPAGTQAVPPAEAQRSGSGVRRDT